MDKKLAVAVRHEFQKCLAEVWPQFQSARLHHPPGWRKFRWQTEANLWFYLALGIMRSSNEFKIELLWNTADSSDVLGTFGLDIQEAVLQSKNRCEIMVPAGPGAHNKLWKVGSHPAYLPQVVVAAAINEMKAFGEPIIEKVLALHGKNLSPSD